MFLVYDRELSTMELYLQPFFSQFYYRLLKYFPSYITLKIKAGTGETV